MNVHYSGKHVPEVLVLLCGLAMTPSAMLNASTPEITVTAQDEQIKGVVRDAMGESVIGANVLIKGTTTGVITDIDGNFVINAPKGSTL